MLSSMGIEDHDRLAVSQILRCQWMSTDRVHHMDGSRDFTDQPPSTFGEKVLDLNTGTMIRVDYKSGTHGFLDMAKALPDATDQEGGYMVVAATIPGDKGRKLLQATTNIQRRWRHRRNLRRWRSFMLMCVVIAKKATQQSPPNKNHRHTPHQPTTQLPNAYQDPTWRNFGAEFSSDCEGDGPPWERRQPRITRRERKNNSPQRRATTLSEVRRRIKRGKGQGTQKEPRQQHKLLLTFRRGTEVEFIDDERTARSFRNTHHH